MPASVYDAMVVERNVIWHSDRLGAEICAREHGWIVMSKDPHAFHVYL